MKALALVLLLACSPVAEASAPPCAPPTPPASDGFYFLVGRDVEPGRYYAPGGSICYWARLSATNAESHEIIESARGKRYNIVTIEPGDVAFESFGCGPWTLLDFPPGTN